jgi:hypothetical protein
MAQGFNGFDAGKSITLAIGPKGQLASLVVICCSTDRAATIIKFGKMQTKYLPGKVFTNWLFFARK